MEFAYYTSGQFRGFRVTGVNEAQADTIRQLSGYAGRFEDGVFTGQSNKRGYADIQSYVNAQNTAAARSSAGMPAATKQRILVPASFTDEQVAVLLGATAALGGRGVQFRITSDHASVHGEHLNGYEGYPGQYVYYTN